VNSPQIITIACSIRGE